MRLTWFILLMLLFFNSSVRAQEMQISVDRDSFLIGEQIELNIEIKSNQTGDIFLPEMDSMGSFEMIKVISSDTQAQALTQKVLLTNFDSGYYQFGPLPALLVPDLGKIDTVYSNTLLLYVNTVPVDTSAAIMPIQQLLEPKFPWKEFLPKVVLPILGGIALLALILYLIWRFTRQKEQLPPPKSMLDYYREALKKLNDLEQQKLWQNDQVKEYYLGLSEILRNYMEGRFGILAMESTTEEILEQAILDKPLKEKLKKVLTQADFAKFAKFRPAPEDNNLMMKLSKDFVAHTKPKSREEIEADV